MEKKTICEKYTLYEDGHVFSQDHNSFLAIRKNKAGYLFFTTYKNNIGKHHSLHRELALAFIPNPLNLKCVNHKDGNKFNNSLENLEWCSYSQNIIHAYNNNLRRTKSVSGHKYVTFENQTKKWRVSVNFGEGKTVKGGRHGSIESALFERDQILATA